MPSPSRIAPRIVVIGAGIAGTNLVRSLAPRLPPACTLTLLSDAGLHHLQPDAA